MLLCQDDAPVCRRSIWWSLLSWKTGKRDATACLMFVPWCSRCLLFVAGAAFGEACCLAKLENALWLAVSCSFLPVASTVRLFGWNALRNCSRPRTGVPVQNITLQAAIQRRPRTIFFHPCFNGRCSFWVDFLRHVGQPGWGPFCLHWVGVSNVLLLWVSVARLFQYLVLSCLVAMHHSSCQQGRVAHMPWDCNCAAPSWLPQDGGSVSDAKLPASSQCGAAASGKGGPMSSCDGSLPAPAAPGAAASSKDTVLPTCDVIDRKRKQCARAILTCLGPVMRSCRIWWKIRLTLHDAVCVSKRVRSLWPRHISHLRQNLILFGFIAWWTVSRAAWRRCSSVAGATFNSPQGMAVWRCVYVWPWSRCKEISHTLGWLHVGVQLSLSQHQLKPGTGPSDWITALTWILELIVSCSNTISTSGILRLVHSYPSMVLRRRLLGGDSAVPKMSSPAGWQMGFGTIAPHCI